MKRNTYITNDVFCLVYFIWAGVYKILNTLNLPADFVNNVKLMQVINLFALTFLGLIVILDLKDNNFKINYIFIIEKIFFVILACLIASHSRGIIFIISAIFIVISSNINFNSVLKTFLLFSGLIFVSALILNAVNFLPSMVRMEGARLRNSLGFSYVSFPSQSLFYIICAWIVWRKNTITYLELIGLELINLYVYSFTKTTSPFVLGSFLIIYVSLLKIFHFGKLITRFRLTRFLASFTFPISFIVLWWLLLYAPSSIFYKINQFVNNRLVLSVNGLQQFGVSVLGKKVTFSGYDVFGQSTNYNFVDSSYIQSLILNGWLYTVLIIGIFTIICIYAVKKKKEYLAVVLIAISIHSMFDPQLMLLWYSPFALLLGKVWNLKQIDSI